MKITRRNFLKVASLGLVLPMASRMYAGEQSGEWRFGVVPDTQWGTVMGAPFYGTSLHVIDAINVEMIRQKVDFVLEVGDLVESSSAIAFQTRADRNKALTDEGIKFYPLRGNHDSVNLDSVKQFKAAFPNLPGTKGNGGSSPDLKNADGMTYSFNHKNGKFILLDTFPLVNDGSKKGKAYKIGEYQPWIDAQLSKDDHQFPLVFAHKNLLGQNHKDNIFSDNVKNQDSAPTMQNNFYESLEQNGVKYFISGHDHMYHRSDIKSPNGKAKLQQIICGSAAHKFYQPEEPFLERETTIVKELNRIGFLIVQVNHEKININYYSTTAFGKKPKTPEWELKDSCGYSFKKAKLV
jgi:hypothetical protein